MTWISLIGITLAVAALIITLAVRTGFRAEFVDTILGANAHVTVYTAGEVTAQGNLDRTLKDYDAWADRIAGVEGVTRAAPLVKGQVMANNQDRNIGVQIFGIRADDLKTIPGIVNNETSTGNIDDFQDGSPSALASRGNLGWGWATRSA